MMHTGSGPVLALLGVLASLLSGTPLDEAQAQRFPARPVTLIVPWPAGGATDIGMRALASATERHLGQPVVVENRPGASGTLGPGYMAASARPDGYTVSQIPITVLRLPFMTRTIGVSGYTFGVAVRADAPWRTFRDLLDYARDHPGKIDYGTPGAGTSPHIGMEQIARAQQIRWTHVPFKGNAEAMNALLGGHIHALADSSGWAQLVNEGRFRLLVTWGASRTRNWPSVPILREVGIDLVASSPFGIAGPKGMDAAVVRTLHDAFRRGMEEPSHGEAMARLDQEPFYLGSEDYHRFAMQQIEEARRFVGELGLRRD
jgi:tripartite-type tricarboxylate transporter receptor subunit TctC